jgi:hypothetical protein
MWDEYLFVHVRILRMYHHWKMLTNEYRGELRPCLDSSYMWIRYEKTSSCCSHKWGGGGRVGKDGTMTCHPHRVTPIPHMKARWEKIYENKSNNGCMIPLILKGQWRDMFVIITSYLWWRVRMAARLHSFRVLGECTESETISGVLSWQAKFALFSNEIKIYRNSCLWALKYLKIKSISRFCLYKLTVCEHCYKDLQKGNKILDA